MAETTYRDLSIWQAAVHLVERCYQATEKIAGEHCSEMEQMQKVAVSIPGEIEQWYWNRSAKHSVVYLRNAKASATELMSLMFKARRTKHLWDTLVSCQVLAESDRLQESLERLIEHLGESGA